MPERSIGWVDQILDADTNGQIVVASDFNAAPDEVPVVASGGDVDIPRQTTPRSSRPSTSNREVVMNFRSLNVDDEVSEVYRPPLG
jgi:hypothetical protein